MTAGRATGPTGRIGWVEKTLGRDHRLDRAGRLHRGARPAPTAGSSGVDPRAKLGMFLAVVLAASLSGSIAVLVALYAWSSSAARGQPDPVRLLRQARLARDPAVRRDRRHPGDLLRRRARACSICTLGPIHDRAVDPGPDRGGDVHRPRRRQRLAGRAARADDALGGPAQEPPGASACPRCSSSSCR